MKIVVCILIGYLIGTLNPAYFISKVKGFDIRKKGSGNAGASNALIVLGKAAGVICAVFDMAKTCVAIGLAEYLFPEFEYAFTLSGVACILGHIFPFYMKFKGGKGLACIGGMILKFDRKIFFIMLAIEVILVLIVDYIFVVPLSASIIFPVVYAIVTKVILGSAILLIGTGAIFYRHRENILRLQAGTEARFSLLWNKDEEIKRISKGE
jgi:glycerol-3-phosphate acyltransferase PlsY